MGEGRWVGSTQLNSTQFKLNPNPTFINSHPQKKLFFAQSRWTAFLFLLLFVWRRSSIELMWFLDCNPVLKKNPKPFYLGSASNSRRPELARTCLWMTLRRRLGPHVWEWLLWKEMLKTAGSTEQLYQPSSSSSIETFETSKLQSTIKPLSWKWPWKWSGGRFFVWKTYFEIFGGNFDCFYPMSWKCSNWFRHPMSLQICLVVADQKVNHSNKPAMNRLGILKLKV